jgi:hypothetical protein
MTEDGGRKTEVIGPPSSAVRLKHTNRLGVVAGADKAEGALSNLQNNPSFQ